MNGLQEYWRSDILAFLTLQEYWPSDIMAFLTQEEYWLSDILAFHTLQLSGDLTFWLLLDCSGLDVLLDF